MLWSVTRLKGRILGRRVIAGGMSVAMATLVSAVPAAAGTIPSMVKDINIGGGSDPAELTDVGGTLYFNANGPDGHELWMSDGSGPGTVQVEDIRTGPVGSAPQRLTRVGALLYFSADDGVKGRELWKSDGTIAGTKRVKDIRPGSAGSDPTNLANIAGTLYFSADDGVKGRELWKSDGTKIGTKRVKDVRSGSGSASPRELTAMGNVVFFTATDGTNGRQVWRSDGSGAGTTRLVADDDYRKPRDLARAGAFVYFIADMVGPGIWITDGTSAGTLAIDNRSSLAGAVLLGGGLYVLSQDGWSLEKVTPTGSELVKDFNQPGDDDLVLGSLAKVAGTLYLMVDVAIFDGNDYVPTERQFWKSDGSESGTELVESLDVQSGPALITAVAGEAFFSVFENGTGRELWRSDGTEGGTTIVADINPAGDSQPLELTEVGNSLYFTADDGVNGRELWRYIP